MKAAATPAGHPLWGAMKAPSKAMRAWPPLNIPITAVARALTGAEGRRRNSLSRHLPRVGLVTVPFADGGDLRLWSRGDDGIANRVFWHGWSGHEPETLAHFAHLARTSRCVIDIGAHVGMFSLVAALANPRAEVFAFEPLPPVYDRLTCNAALNGVRNLSCLKLAVGRRPGQAVLFHRDSGVPSSSSIDRSFMTHAVPEDLIVSSEVPMVTVDQFVSDRALVGIDLVKLDIEAAEHEALAGMVDTLSRDRPNLVCEVLPQGRPQDIEEMLSPLGYRYFLLTGTGPEHRSRLTANERWRNYLLVPSGRPAPWE